MVGEKPLNTTQSPKSISTYTATLDDIDESVKERTAKSKRRGAFGSRQQHATLAQQDERMPTEYPSLPNGTRLTPDAGVDGYGELNVNNGTADDAEIILYNVEKDEKTRDVI